MMKQKRLAIAMVAALASSPLQAAVVWDFNYTDVNTGFNDATSGAARQNALESAANYVSSFLTGYTATIQMDVDGSVSGGGTLAAAGSAFNGVTNTPGFGIQGDVMTKILGGTDPSAGRDGSVTWNFTDFNWELGSNFQAGEFDFFSTAVHELLHALGFASEIQENGNDGYSNTPGTPGAWAPFDQFLTDYTGTAIVDSTTFVLDQSIWDATKLSADGSGVPGCNAGIQFTGANAVAANGGNAVQIYSPATWEGGSSGSHLDDNCYTTPGLVSTYLMEAQTISGLGNRTLSALEIGLMRDIGYTNFGVQTTTNVPVPSTIYLTLGALGLLGFSSRKNSH